MYTKVSLYVAVCCGMQPIRSSSRQQCLHVHAVYYCTNTKIQMQIDVAGEREREREREKETPGIKNQESRNQEIKLVFRSATYTLL
jgi:hypothetical protein